MSTTRTLARLLVASLPVWAVACSNDTGVGAGIHDTKYVAVGFSGEELSASGGTAPCVLDRYTGLMWEVKSDDGGLHDHRFTYTWYDPAESNDPQGLDYRGQPDGGECRGSACDTWAYVRAVNAAGLCGHSDWRVPLRDEIASISDPRRKRSPPTTNMKFFSNARPFEYWTSNDYHFRYDAAWVWDFSTGLDRVEWKSSSRPVRLVRGQAQQLAQVED